MIIELHRQHWLPLVQCVMIAIQRLKGSNFGHAIFQCPSGPHRTQTFAANCSFATVHYRRSAMCLFLFRCMSSIRKADSP